MENAEVSITGGRNDYGALLKRLWHGIFLDNKERVLIGIGTRNKDKILAVTPTGRYAG